MMSNFVMPRKKKYPLSLDEIFGHIFYNVPGDSITPTRIATLYLLRVLFETHFGKRRDPTPTPLTVKDKNWAFKFLYGLMNEDEEMSYDDFRRYVRMSFPGTRGIPLDFFACMEKIGSGESDVVLGVPDEFYTNKHSRPRDVFGRFLFPPHYDPDRHALPFSSSQSVMYRWLKRLLSQAAKTTPIQMFNINQAMRKWINSKHNETYFRELPTNEDPRRPWWLSSSMKSRHWVQEYLRFLQMNSHMITHYDGLIEGCELIEKHHKDVHTAHLLKAVVHVQNQDGPNAINCMKMYFDLTQFMLTDDMGNAMRTYRLTVPTTLPLLYGPVLQARICRTLGDYTQARLLLQESIQQSQLRSDEICHQLANLELHILDILGSEPLLEDRLDDDIPEHVETDRRIHRKTLKNLDDLHHQFFAAPCCSQTTEDFEFCSEMDSIGKMLMLLRKISKGAYRLYFGRIIETGILNPTSTDFEERGNRVYAYGDALVTSNMIRNGMYKQAQNTAEAMLVNNCSQLWPEDCFLTETWAVALVNLAYSHAGQGDFKKASAVLQGAAPWFTEKMSWQGNRHIIICDAIISFEQAFLFNEYQKCKNSLSHLCNFSQLEYKLRLALLWASRGDNQRAVDLLATIDTKDVRGKIRIHMQRATIYVTAKQHEKAWLDLAEAQKLAEGTTFIDLKAMVIRRRATLLLDRGSMKECMKEVLQCFEVIDLHGSFTEKCCLFLTVARCLREGGMDPRVWLKRARILVRGGKWPSMEKMILAELAILHGRQGLLPDTTNLSRVREQFGKLHAEHPGKCQWLLI